MQGSEEERERNLDEWERYCLQCELRLNEAEERLDSLESSSYPVLDKSYKELQKLVQDKVEELKKKDPKFELNEPTDAEIAEKLAELDKDEWICTDESERAFSNQLKLLKTNVERVKRDYFIRLLKKKKEELLVKQG